ncbi:hypothetical protein PR048_028997 [Dryococelus australis]|uniref:Uncharacterized protein n=1 Tax=Dryococelus australis TaxID=614101 RepID=A0ABQ9GFS5_9NEOP|nr:hypothetical protein PR048_028997 [Dryococelus australis]
MSTQAYYKDRLGFDPNEALYDGASFEKTQQGYEENLSKFKGLWGFFIESIGTVWTINLKACLESSVPVDVSETRRQVTSHGRSPDVYKCVARNELSESDTSGDGNHCTSSARLHHCGSNLDPRLDLRSTQKTVAPFELRAGLEIEMKLISNRRNRRSKISIRDQQPWSTNIVWKYANNINELEIENREISLVQLSYIGTKIKLDPGSELGSFDLGSRKMLVQPGIRFSRQDDISCHKRRWVLLMELWNEIGRETCGSTWRKLVEHRRRPPRRLLHAKMGVAWLRRESSHVRRGRRGDLLGHVRGVFRNMVGDYGVYVGMSSSIENAASCKFRAPLANSMAVGGSGALQSCASPRTRNPPSRPLCVDTNACFVPATASLGNRVDVCVSRAQWLRFLQEQPAGLVSTVAAPPRGPAAAMCTTPVASVCSPHASTIDIHILKVRWFVIARPVTRGQVSTSFLIIVATPICNGAVAEPDLNVDFKDSTNNAPLEIYVKATGEEPSASEVPMCDPQPRHVCEFFLVECRNVVRSFVHSTYVVLSIYTSVVFGLVYMSTDSLNGSSALCISLCRLTETQATCLGLGGQTDNGTQSLWRREEMCDSYGPHEPFDDGGLQVGRRLVPTDIRPGISPARRRTSASAVSISVTGSCLLALAGASRLSGRGAATAVGQFCHCVPATVNPLESGNTSRTTARHALRNADEAFRDRALRPDVVAIKHDLDETQLGSTMSETRKLMHSTSITERNFVSEVAPRFDGLVKHHFQTSGKLQLARGFIFIMGLDSFEAAGSRRRYTRRRCEASCSPGALGVFSRSQLAAAQLGHPRTIFVGSLVTIVLNWIGSNHEVCARVPLYRWKKICSPDCDCGIERRSEASYTQRIGSADVTLSKVQCSCRSDMAEDNGAVS